MPDAVPVDHRLSQPADEHGPPAPVDILIVDDHPAKRLALETALAPLGENVVAVGSGRDALRHLLTRDFATIILDVNMPDLDGFETARMIRSRRRSAATPIIFTSAVNMEEADAYRGYSLGAVDYICAPIVPEVLRAKVSVFVQLHRTSEQARLQAERLKERTRELEQSQRELRMSERMASIGTLCAGLGHDMGNLLLPISVWADSMESARLPEDLHEGVASLRSCIQYLRKLAGGLRLVSLDPSQDIGDRRVVLQRWVDEVSPILRNALPRGVTLEIDVPTDLPDITIAPHRLAQATFNLVQNAGEAMRGRQDGLVRLWARRDPGGVRIGITDNGPGMSREVLNRCLDPYFTTKTRGISTGLGLSLVHGIVQTAGSRLDISSAAGEGTTFSFVLPPAPSASQFVAQAIVTIDDVRVRALASALARSAGCEVVSTLSDHHQGPAVWITSDPTNLSGHAEQFARGRRDRQILVISDDASPAPTPPEAPSSANPTSSSDEAPAPTIYTNTRGLVMHLRRFLSPPASAREPAPAGAS